MDNQFNNSRDQLGNLNLNNDQTKTFAVYKNIESFIKKIEISKENESIIFLVRGIIRLFRYDLEKATKIFKEYEQKYNADISISKFCLHLIENIKGEFNKMHETKEISDYKHFITLICGTSNFMEPEYGWQWDILKTILQTNFPTKKEPLAKTNYYRVIKNFSLPIFSTFYDDIASLINAIHSNSRVVILLCHGELKVTKELTQTELKIQFKPSLNQQIWQNDRHIVLGELLNLIAMKQNNIVLMLYSCDTFFDKNIRTGNNKVIFNTGKIGQIEILPFTFCFFFAYLYDGDFKKSFNFARTITELFTDRASKFEFSSF